MSGEKRASLYVIFYSSTTDNIRNKMYSIY